MPRTPQRTELLQTLLTELQDLSEEQDHTHDISAGERFDIAANYFVACLADLALPLPDEQRAAALHDLLRSVQQETLARLHEIDSRRQSH